MGLFRNSKTASSAPASAPRPDVERDEDGLPLTPTQPLRDIDREEIDGHLRALAEVGVDVDDLASLSDGLDAAYQAWAVEKDSDHGQIVQRFSIGIGEHLARHTDLEWSLVSDVFGTDLGLVESRRAMFMVVPSNIVAARWMRGETMWIPDVVGHLVRRRDR